MPLLDRQGKPLSQNDVMTIVTMLKGAYENHIKTFQRESRSSVLAQIFADTYEKRMADLQKDYMDKFASKDNFDADEILNSELINSNTIAREKYRERVQGNNFIKAVGNNREDNIFYADYITKLDDYTGYIPPEEVDSDVNKIYNTKEAYDRTESAFKLADEAMPGIENIISYNPNSDRVRSLHEPRSGNSTTLASNDENVRNKGIFSFDSGAELSRIKASEIMSKMEKGQDIGFGDLFDAFSSLNEFARLGDPEGGKIRSGNVSAGKIIGVSAFKAPSRIYKTLDKAASYMNQIRDTQDPNLKKTRAVQLASFLYSMTISEHVFGDGNGRSCRLLADTILQSFGLPPHIPNETTKGIGGTIGDNLDFNVSAKGFFEGVSKSSDVLKEVQATEALAKQEREAAEAEEQELELQNNHDNTKTALSVWDEVINDTKLPLGLVSLAERFKRNKFDVSNPTMMRLLTHYNQESGKVETLNLNGHKNEEGYPSPTGFTNTKQGAIDFLYELDNVLDEDDLYDYNEASNSERGLFFTSLNKRDTSSYHHGTYESEVYLTYDKFKEEPPVPVNKPTRFMSFMNTLFGGYKEQFASYNTYLTKKAEYDQRLEAFNKKNKALNSFAENNQFTIQKSKKVAKDYSAFEDKIKANRTIDEKLNDLAQEELDPQKTIDVITGRKKIMLGSSPNYRELLTTELERVEGLPMEGLALIAANSVEINKNIADSSTQYPQELEFREGFQYTPEDEEFRKLAEAHQANVNISSKIQDSLFSGTDTRMGTRFAAVVESRKKLNEAAKAYQSGNKQPLINLLKDSLPPIFSNMKVQADTALTSSGKAQIEMADALHQLLEKDPEIKQQLQIPDEDLNKLYAASSLIKEIVYPKQRQNESFKKYMVEGAEDKLSYVKEMMYSSYLADILKKQTKSGISETSKEYSTDTSKAIERYSGNLVAAGKTKNLYGDSKVEVTISNKIMEEHLKYPDIYSKFETEEGINSLKTDFENKIVNSPEFNTLLTKSREELAEMDFKDELKNIVGKNKEREKANAEIKVNQQPNVQPEIIEVKPTQEINLESIPQNLIQNDPILNNIVNGPKENQLNEQVDQIKEFKSDVKLDDELKVPDFSKKQKQTVEKAMEKAAEFAINK